jgi:predicted RNase H-related nuclease YkuK (DUF458 family)
MFKNKFKKFGGEYIPDIVEYIQEYVKRDPTVTISVGCDSIQKRKRTIYACTIMMYNGDIKNGAHVVFFRENHLKIRDHHERLHKEAQYTHDIATYLDNELKDIYSRTDLTELERKKYKYHLHRCEGEYGHLMPHQEDSFIKFINLTEYESSNMYRTVDIHVDFNPSEGSLNEKGVMKNKSYTAYKSYVPWLRSLNFRVYAKPIAYAATSAADLLLQD